MNEHEFSVAEYDRISITLAEIDEFSVAENSGISNTLSENDGVMLNEGTPTGKQNRSWKLQRGRKKVS